MPPQTRERLWGNRPLPQDALPLDKNKVPPAGSLTQTLLCSACGAEDLTHQNLREHPLGPNRTALVHADCPKALGLNAWVSLRLIRSGQSVLPDSPDT